MKQWVHIEILAIEHYVMDLKLMVITQNLVKEHGNNTNILHYKMEMVIKDGVLVRMTLVA